MANQYSISKTRLLIAIIATVLGVAGIVLPFIFREGMLSFWNYFITIFGAIFLFVGLFTF